MRPARCLEISAHLFSPVRFKWYRISSSSLLQSAFLIQGFKWLCQRSLHYLPIRPGRCPAISVHLIRTWVDWISLGPPLLLASALPSRVLRVRYGRARERMTRSSAAVHGPFTSSGLRTFCQRCRHCTSVRPVRQLDMSFQLRA